MVEQQQNNNNQDQTQQNMQLAVFSDNFKILDKDGNQIQMDLKVYGTFDKPLFRASDIGDIFGVYKMRDVVSKYDEDEVCKGDCLANGQARYYLTLKGLYRYIYSSKKPIGRQFRDFISQLLIDIQTNKIKLLYHSEIIDLCQKMIDVGVTQQPLNFLQLSDLYNEFSKEHKEKYDKLIEDEKKGIIYIIERKHSFGCGTPIKIQKEQIDELIVVQNIFYVGQTKTNRFDRLFQHEDQIGKFCYQNDIILQDKQNIHSNFTFYYFETDDINSEEKQFIQRYTNPCMMNRQHNK